MSGPSPRSSRVLRPACVSVMLAAVVLTCVPPAAGQETASRSVELQLLRQPVWQRPSDPLDIRLRITNRGMAPVEGFLLSLTAHPVVGTRSALHESFLGNAGAITGATSETLTTELGAGESMTLTIDEDFEIPSSLTSDSEGGVYPLTISLSDAAGVVPYDTLTTPLILYPERPEVPLKLSMVIPLNALPSRGPDAVFRDPLGGDSIPLETAVAEGGWFAGLVEALEAHAGELPDVTRTVTERLRRRNGRGFRTRTRTVSRPQRGLHLGIAPVPRFLEEAADMADGYRRAAAGGPRQVESDAPVASAAAALLDTFSTVLDEDGVQTLLVPYSFPDIPALTRYAPDRLDLELDEGADVLANVLDQEPSREWLFAPAGRLGSQALEELRFSDSDTARHTFFDTDAFEIPATVAPSGCPVAFASFTCPVSVRTAAGPTTGLVGDRGLQDRFADLVQKRSGPLELQNFFAETVAIRQELPSVSDRIAHVTMPSLWHPRPRIIRRLLAGLRGAPWLQTVTPDEAVDLRDPTVRTDEFVETYPPLSSDPGETLFDEIEETTTFLEAFRRMHPPDQMVERLRRNTLVAQSRIWWPGTALSAVAADYLRGSEQIARDEIAKVTVAGPEEINLTSQEGEIPLVVANRTRFPTTVRIAMHSPERDLLLEPQELPAQRIDAGGTFQFTVAAVARSSGIFQMEVVVDTPGGELDITTKSITIRSTAFNRVALGLTVGALIFLVVFYVLRLFRRRRDASS